MEVKDTRDLRFAEVKGSQREMKHEDFSGRLLEVEGNCDSTFVEANTFKESRAMVDFLKIVGQIFDSREWMSSLREPPTRTFHALGALLVFL